MKLFLETYDDRYKDRIAFLEKIKEPLHQLNGMEFVENYEDADIVVSQQTAYAPNLEFCLNQKKDVIILEVNDTATIFNNELRNAIKNPIVKGFFKVTNFANIEDHNKPTSGDVRYHANFIDEYEKISSQNPHAIIFEEKELSKIKCAMPAFLNFRMDQVRQVQTFSSHQRDIDVNFAGTTDYTKNKNYVNLPEDDPKLELPVLIGAHRKRCLVEVIEAQQSMGIKVLLSDHKPMSQPQYWSSLYRSKVCLSPWGFGAYNWRDYESIYLGALLIKPDTSFLETYCNLFQGEKNYVKCSHDFSDLKKVISSCLENYDDYNPVRESALSTLNKNSNPSHIANRFANQITECLQQR
mgnify:CR=1 FL=1